jgi:hypothetical protein
MAKKKGLQKPKHPGENATNRQLESYLTKLTNYDNKLKEQESAAKEYEKLIKEATDWRKKEISAKKAFSVPKFPRKKGGKPTAAQLEKYILSMKNLHKEDADRKKSIAGIGSVQKRIESRTKRK